MNIYNNIIFKNFVNKYIRLRGMKSARFLDFRYKKQIYVFKI